MTSPEPAPTTTATTTTTTSSRAAEPTSAARPAEAADGALFDAIATEHATIYGYGLVSAHSTPDVNDLEDQLRRITSDLRLFDHGFALVGGLAVSVRAVERAADNQPDAEAYPGLGGKTEHDEDAGRHRWHQEP